MSCSGFGRKVGFVSRFDTKVQVCNQDRAGHSIGKFECIP